MKKTLLIFSVFIFTCSCSPKISSQGIAATVEFVNHDEEGTITVRSSGYGEKITNASYTAQRNAFYVLLFKGVPGSKLKMPLIENEYEANQKNGDYLDNLLNKGGYSKFTVSSTNNYPAQKEKGGGYGVSLNVKINYNSLRKDLEQNNLIRKFGF